MFSPRIDAGQWKISRHLLISQSIRAPVLSVSFCATSRALRMSSSGLFYGMRDRHYRRKSPA
jgi:hypothetical protein